MELEALAFYVIATSLSSALYIEYHRRLWPKPKCTACRSHSYWIPAVLAFYSLSLGVIVLFTKDFLGALDARILFIYTALIVVGLLPFLPLNHWKMRPFPKSPYLVSSWTLFGFQLAIILIVASYFALEEFFYQGTELYNVIVSRLSSLLPVPIALAAAVLGVLAYFFISPPPKGRAGSTAYNMFRHGKGYLMISTVLILIGFGLLIIRLLFLS